MYEKIEGIFTLVMQYLILIIELIGVAVLIWAIIRALISLIKHKMDLRLELAEGIALSLEFKMGGELLRTVIVREWNELLILGAIIILRAALTFLIQWEIKNERKKEAFNKESRASENKTLDETNTNKNPLEGKLNKQ